MKLATLTGDFDRYCDRYIERIFHIYEAGFCYVDLTLCKIRENDELMVAENWRENAAAYRKNVRHPRKNFAYYIT